MKYLDKKLKKEVRKVFEPRYGRKLSNDEVIEIATNLTSYMKNYFKFFDRIKNEKRRV